MPPDEIKKCSGIGCKLAFNCHRFLMNSADYQDWFTLPPHTDEGEACLYFIEKETETPVEEIDTIY